jgi:AbiV family abortive infection protein
MLNYLEGANMALDNSKSLSEIGQKAAEINHYGVACALSILSAEEAIKAFLCINKHYIPLAVEKSRFDSVFRDHKIKHKHIIELLKYMRIALDQSRDTMQFLGDNIDYYIQTRARPITINDKEALKSMVARLREIVDRPLAFTEDEISDWWEQANIEKNKGLYVDLRSSQWHNPAHTNIELYFQSFEYSKVIFEYTVALQSFHLINKIIDEGK